MVLLEHVFRRFNELNDLSHSAEVTGNVQSVHKEKGSRTPQPPPPPPHPHPLATLLKRHLKSLLYLLTRRVSGTIASNPSKVYMSKAKASNQLGNKGGKAVRALASHQCVQGSNLDVKALCELSLLMILSFDPRSFSTGTFCYYLALFRFSPNAYRFFLACLSWG